MWKVLLLSLLLESVLGLPHVGPLQRKQMALLSKLKHFDSAFPKLPETQAKLEEFPKQLELQFDGLGKEFHLRLEKNERLFSKDYFYEEQTYDPETKELVRRKRFDGSAARNCFYHGHAGSPGSSVAVSTCDDGVRGLILAHNEAFFIEPREVGQSTNVHRTPGAMREHIIYRVADVHTDGYTCGQEADVFQHGINIVNPSFAKKAEKQARSLNKRDDTKYVELFVANDNSRFEDKGETTEIESAGIINIVDMLYKNATFVPPIRVVLVGQVTFLETDPFTPDMVGDEVSVSSYLSKWNAWRSNPGTKPQHHDCGHLFSSLDFQSTTIGYAGVGAMCFDASSGGIEQVTFSDAHNAAVVAHEMGHNFGMQHDSTGNACPSGGFIMGATLSTSSFPAVNEFSTCSHDYLDEWFEENPVQAQCLNNLPDIVYGDPICGNGFVEEGEDCDCGSDVDCTGKDKCCNAATCKFVTGAECRITDPCCSDECKIVTADAKKVCRPSSGECDLQDVCDGESAKCPEDVFEITGIECDDGFGGDGACYLGQCLSHNQQCRTLNPTLFDDGPYKECPFQKQLNQGNFCGSLFCTTNKPADKNTCYSFNLYGSLIETPDGVPCGSGKQCYQGTCVKSSTLPGGDPVTDVNGSSVAVMSISLLVGLIYLLL